VTDPLLTDDLPTLLGQFPTVDLHGIVSILKAHRSWSIFPGTRAGDAHRAEPGDDLGPQISAITQEILWWGSHDLHRQFGEERDWRTVVANTALQFGVDRGLCGEAVPAWRIERALLLKALADWEQLDPEQREESVQKAGAAWGASSSVLALIASLIVESGAIRLAGYLPTKVIAATVTGAPFAPVATVLGAAWVGYDLAGPGYRVLRPIALTIALTRFRLRDGGAAAAFGDSP